MLLTITTTHPPATDLGYLLRKNPARVQSFPQSFGTAHVFYPEATSERCTAALLLEVDPVGLVRNRRGPGGEGCSLEQYVNDRPYVGSSFLSVAIGDVFGSAMTGKSKERPELADACLPLEATLAVLPCRGGENVLRSLFEPLGYTVKARGYPLDSKFGDWGDSPYLTVTLEGKVRLSQLLTHLYVLIPVLDNDKHYWVGDDEVEKLLRRGEGWLASHPQRDLITSRYLKHRRSLINDALERLVGEEDPTADASEEAHTQEEARVEERISLNEQRLGAVLATLKSSGAKRVLDLGCGEGKLLHVLLKERQFEGIPDLSLVVLIGASGSGKSSFVRKHFKPTEVLSSDYCRGLVSDDENNQAATNDAFEVLHFIARKRLAAGKLTVVDATNVQPESRKPLVELAREFHCLPVAIVLNLPERLCHERNQGRPDRDFGPHVVRQQVQQLRRSLRGLEREGFRHVFILNSPEEVDTAAIERQPLWNNRKEEHGPFDIIGDVHGCYDELVELLGRLGYRVAETAEALTLIPPSGRKLVFLGDIVDRGPKIVPVLKLVMSAVAAGTALCVPGNHDMKLLRKLRGKDVQIRHGLAESLAQLEAEPETFRDQVAAFIDDLVSHYVLDGGKLVVAHAGMKETMQGRGSGKVRDFALYGETTGEIDEFGLPVRYNWAAEYRGKAMVVYGHTPVPEPEWLNRTINVDTGCVFGGKLTALRYPEKELVSVPARQTYAQPAKPFLIAPPAASLSAQQQHDGLPDLEDVLGKRILSTRLGSNVTIREENAAAALEVMSRFAANPKWLIYLPPTMSPSETTKEPGLLEHPAEAFAYYRHEGIPKVICEQKHMGSRAVVIVCRSEEAARQRFGVVGEGLGICYTHTGRRFFDDGKVETALLDTIRSALERAGFWDEFKSDWVCLDCELMPWSAKAQALIKDQYAAVGAAAQAALAGVVETLTQAASNGAGVKDLLNRHQERQKLTQDYVQAYQRYCWPVSSLADLKLAPFHLLATEGQVHADKDHVWHMDTLRKVCAADATTLLLATPYKLVDVTDGENQSAGVQWWEELTGSGGEGMVVKPLDFVARGRRGLVQPAVKCRGREYLRIIYGPEYTLPENLERLRARGLSAKRSLAIREFALGIEALERFVRQEPLRRVHECVFGVLALESEPVDPRL